MTGSTVTEASISPDPHQASLSRRTAIGAGWLVAFRILTRTIGLISTLALARVLMPSDFGLIAMATAFAAAVESLSQIGVQDALLRQREDDRSLFDTAFTLQALRGLVTGCLIALSAPAAAQWFAEPRLVPVLLVLALTSAAGSLENVGIVTFRRGLRYHYQFVLQATPRIAGACATIAWALVLRNYWALLVGVSVSAVIRLIASYWLHPYRPRFSLARWRELSGFSFWLWLTSLACLVWDRCDPFVLGPVLGTTQLGIYLLAAEIATLPLTELVQPAAEVLFAGFSAARREGTDAIGLALTVAVTLLLIVAPMAIGISAGAGYVVAILLGPEWAAAQPLVGLLAFLGLFSPFTWVSSMAMTACGFVRHNFGANAVASAMKVSILTVTAAVSGDMFPLAIASLVIMGLEAGIFVTALAASGHVHFHRLCGPMLRIAIGVGAALLAASGTGLAWRAVPLAPGAALARGCLLGIAVVLAYGAAVYVGWTIAGKPEGPETRLLAIGRDIFKPLLDQFRARARTVR
jgi:lipopolysaccharide exporter